MHHRLKVAALLALTSACVTSSDVDSDSQASSLGLRSLFADASKLDVSDLTRASVVLATSGLNDNLTAGSNGISFVAPTVYATAAQPNRVLPGNMEVRGLNTIVSGLGARFGEYELSTQVNAARLRHLEKGDDKYFVESGFALKAGVANHWRFNTQGFLAGEGVDLGFDAGVTLSSRIIVATPDQHLKTLLEAPVQALKETRGFIYPRSIQEIEAMKPGEMFALRGAGKLGANFGIGVPLLFANPAGPLTYQIVASAGVAGVIQGNLDVQLVRLEGDEVVVDVGVEKGKGLSFRAGIADHFGIKGLCDDGQSCLRAINLGVTKVDLAKLVERAIENRINEYLSFSLSGGTSESSSRVSLSRFRFHLSEGNREEVEAALKQTLMFDMRLAQALYNRDLKKDSPPVVAEFDVVRSATTSTRDFGFEVLGMNIYHRAFVEKKGTFVVQTPTGRKSILFESVHKDSGWFQTDHGFTRTGISTQTLDPKSPERFRSEANLFVQTAVGDRHMDNDLIIDSADAVISSLAGSKALEAIDQAGNEIQRLVWNKCGQDVRFDEKCNVELLDSEEMMKLKAQARDALAPHLTSLPPDFQYMVNEAAELRLALLSVGITTGSFGANGPSASFTFDMRLDDGALAKLTSQSKDAYVAALTEYLSVVGAKRGKEIQGGVFANIDRQMARNDAQRKWKEQINVMGDVFEARAKEYRQVADVEAALPDVLKDRPFDAYPLSVRFKVERDNAPAYTTAVAESASTERARLAAALYDALVDAAKKLDDLPHYKENAALFPLVALVSPDHLDVGTALRAEAKDTFWHDRTRYQKVGFGAQTGKCAERPSNIPGLGPTLICQAASAPIPRTIVSEQLSLACAGKERGESCSVPANARATGANSAIVEGGMFDIDAIIHAN